MDKQYDNELRGVLFRNDKKEKETQPDFKGDVTVEGQEYWLSAWVQESKKGTKYFSLSLQPKDKAHQQGMEKVQKAMNAPAGMPEDDIPFAPVPWQP